MTEETRAIEVCRRYVEAQELVKCLTRKIGNALRQCPQWEDVGDDGVHSNNHLRRALQSSRYVVDWDGETQVDYASADTMNKRLAECPHCLAAYDLIQQRKEARQVFGRAKAMITRIGRSK